jgi:hypothetical protein
LNRYKREVNKAKSTEENIFFLDKPAHDRYSHGADSFGYMAIVYRHMRIGDRILGATEPEHDFDQPPEGSESKFDLLGVK